jgi:DNA mismatch repair protein MutS
MPEDLTPMMRQYHDVKRKLPGKIILFRLGDFYEMFFEDAVVAAKELEITLTSRNKDTRGQPIPMCGVPHHAVDGYVARLIKKGYKVAICDQLEEPRPGKLVKREVTRVITPGTVTEDVMLDPKDNNYIASLFQRGDGFGAAFLDVSTGELLVTQGADGDPAAKLVVELNHFQPAEILFPKANAPLFRAETFGALLDRSALTELDDWSFHPEFAQRIFLASFGAATLEGFGLADRELAVAAAGALLHYVQETNRLPLGNLLSYQYFEAADFLKLDTESVTNLELVRALDGGTRNTLLATLDFTSTNMGGRMLKNWILRPLMDPAAIADRQGGVDELTGQYLLRQRIQSCLSGVQDVERLLSKISAGTARPRDLLALKGSLAQFPPFRDLALQLASPVFRAAAGRFDPLADVHHLLQQAIHEEPPPTLNEGGVIKDGYSAELDELRGISRGGKQFIARLEAEERERTGIGTLKVGYNRVFGYYIEVTRTNLAAVPAHYIRKQTLANAERFITEDLKAYEEKVLTAEERIVRLERDLYADIRQRLMGEFQRIKASAQVIAQVDVLAALAEAAVRHRYVRPVVDASPAIRIAGGRHPVIEHIETAFVPNDCLLDDADHQLVILTGPNMGGKSTYLRQTALIAIMAQMGSFVPADAARVGLVDQIFTRVGASDNLARGRSTFMVEMVETAGILNTCTPRSLILLDEVGRGTATFDGLSIAWAVAEYLHNTPAHRARTLFATHYHEITRLAALYPGIQNYCVTVKEGMGEIVFLRKVAPGTGSRSYGIEVARLAGMPPAVLQRAEAILRKLERKEIDLAAGPRGKGAEDDIIAEIQKRLF